MSHLITTVFTSKKETTNCVENLYHYIQKSIIHSKRGKEIDKDQLFFTVSTSSPKLHGLAFNQQKYPLSL